jgi:hypothetical protein
VDTSHQHEKKKKKKKKKKNFTIVSLAESFFFYDSPVRRVWIEEGKRPVVRITGSYQYSCLFGAISMKDNIQLFRQYAKFNTETFPDYLKIIHSNFPKCYLYIHGQGFHHHAMNPSE